MNAWKITLRKTLRAALGLLVCSIGSYCTIVADVGLAPWDALFMGVSEHLPVSYGTVSVTCGLIVVVVDLLMHEKIGVGMLLDAFMVGKVIDLLRYLDVLAQPTSYAMRVGLMILGITILCCGLPIYMGAGLCCGPRDALLVGLGKRVRKDPHRRGQHDHVCCRCACNAHAARADRHRYAAGCGAAGPDHAAGVPYHAL